MDSEMTERAVNAGRAACMAEQQWKDARVTDLFNGQLDANRKEAQAAAASTVAGKAAFEYVQFAPVNYPVEPVHDGPLEPPDTGIKFKCSLPSITRSPEMSPTSVPGAIPSNLEVEALYKIDGSVSINLSREQLEDLRRGAGLQLKGALHEEPEVLELKQRLQEKVGASSSNLGDWSTALERVQHVQDMVDQRSDQVVAEIERNFEQHLEALRQRRSELLNEVSTFKCTKSEMLKVKADGIRNHISSAEEMIESVQRGLNEWTDIMQLVELEHRFNVSPAEHNKHCAVSSDEAALAYTVGSDLLLAIPLLGQVHTARAVASRCLVHGDGLTEAWRGKQASVTITACDGDGLPTHKGGDVVEVVVQSMYETQHAKVLDQGDGTYLVTYVPTEAGEQCLSVTLHGKHIENSPFFVTVRGGRDYSKVVGAPEQIWGGMDPSDASGCFNRPRGMAVDAEGRIIVADEFNHRVQVLNPDGSWHLSFGSQGASNGRFNQVAAIAVGYTGHIICTDRKNHRVQVFRPDGTFVFKFGSAGSMDGCFNHPTGVAVDTAASQILVVDKDNHRVQVFHGDGSFSHKFGSRGSADGQLEWPAGIAVDSSRGTAVVADKNNHRICVFDLQGGFVRSFGSQGSGPGEFQFPWDVSIDPEGHILVVDESGRVQVFESDGAFAHQFGNEGDDTQQLKVPWGIAVTADGSIFVADRASHSIKVY